MSMTNTSGPGAPPVPPSAPPAMPLLVAPAAVKMRRRSPGRIALVAAIAALGGLVSAALWIGNGHRVAVLVVAVPLTAGQQITDADLAVANISLDPAVATIPAAQKSSIVGKRASMQIAPGAVLSRADVTDTPLVPSGSSVVGIQLKPGQLPASRLVVGEAVTLVFTPNPNAPVAPTSGSSSTTQLPTTAQATVVDVGSAGENGNQTVDVAVPATQAPGLAAQASTGNIALIASPTGGK